MSAAKGRPDATGRSSGKIGGRKGKMQKPPQGEPWVWLTAEMLASDAWRSLSINARRFIDALQLDHMAHAGTENGNLMATRSQLEAFGLSVNHITSAIRECEEKGLVKARRAGMRIATKYRLTWLADRDFNPATNEWKAYRNSGICPLKGDSLPPKQRSDNGSLPPKQRSVPTPQIEAPSIFSTPLRKSGGSPRNTLSEAQHSISALGDPRFSGVTPVKGIEYMALFDRAMARRSANAA